MPIVRINPDGTVRIARKSGKDPIDVLPEELINYNPTLLADYNKFIGEQKTFESGTQGQTAAQAATKEKESGAKEVIDQLFNIYYGKEGEKPLSLTEAGKWRTPAQLKSLTTKVKAGKANSIEERIYTYNRILESKRSKLAKAAGDAGNLALQEQILAGRGLPDPASTYNESVTLFDSAYGAFAGGNRPERLTQDI